MLKTGLMLMTILGVAAIGQPADAQSQNRGTREQQEACSRDVNRYCRKLVNEPDMVILRCLQENRQRLTRSCQRMLESHGQ